MNIFYLSENPKECAEMHCDKHVVKMIIEYAQLMSTAHRILDGQEYIDKTANGRRIKRWRMKDDKIENGLMKASHINHPSAVWTRESKQNYTWLNQLWNYLLLEYTHRYGKQHACEKYREFLYVCPQNIPDKNFTEPTPAMPDEVKILSENSSFIKKYDSLKSYKNYYILNKRHLASWKKRNPPGWYKI
jgi:hypothetical protein